VTAVFLDASALWGLAGPRPPSPSKVASQHFLYVASIPPHEEGNARAKVVMVKNNICSILQRYAAAFLSVLAALLITLAGKSLFSTTSYGLFLCAVMFSAWRGGLLPGLVATLLSALALDYYFIPPFRRLGL